MGGGLGSISKILKNVIKSPPHNNQKKMYNSLFRPGLGLEELYKEVQDNMTNGSILIIDNLSFLSLLGFSDR